MWLFQLKLMDASEGVGWSRAAVATADMCNDMKINTCGETTPDNPKQARRRCVSRLNHVFLSSCWSQRGWTEVEESKGGKEIH